MLCIENANIVLPAGILPDGIVLTQGKTIAAVGKRGEVAVPENARRIDAGGAFVGPGFVDIHAHGGGGYMYWQEPEKAAEFFLRRGTTTALPALYNTLTLQELLESMDRIEAAMAGKGAGSIIRGFYMEGPYMNPDFGASKHKNKWLAPVDPADYKQLVQRAGSLAKIWVVAPEREGIEDFVEYVRSVNPRAVFSVGHSCATPEQIRKLPITHQTHCMNATGRVGDMPGVRGVGPDEACFLDKNMYAELISDSRAVHVCPDMQKLVLQVKGVSNVVLISDNSGRKSDDPNTDLSFDDHGNLGGSLLSLDMACRNIRKHTGCDMVQAFLMASTNPAKAVGMDGELGSIVVGKRADLVFVDSNFRVQQVMLGGVINCENI